MKHQSPKNKEWKDMTPQEKRNVYAVWATIGALILFWITSDFRTALGLVLVGYAVYFVVKAVRKSGTRMQSALVALAFFITSGVVLPSATDTSTSSTDSAASIKQDKPMSEAKIAERKKLKEKAATERKIAEKERAAKQKAEKFASLPACDGTAVKANCKVDNVAYEKYLYYPAVPEKIRTETFTTYREEVTSYCTLCNDGSYSPSCSTGRGTCSRHGGVAQWNAPRTSQVPVQENRAVVEVPAKAAYYDMVVDKNFSE